MIGLFLVRNEDNKRVWIRADEVGTIYETDIYPKPARGRPSESGPKAVAVVMLTLRNNIKVAARDQSIESVLNMMRQALGTSIHLVSEPAYDGGDPKVTRGEAA